MGQKINPIGLRLGINRTWDSRWFAGKAEYGKLLHEDVKIREILHKELKQAAVARIVIERPHKKCRVTIHSARPGVVIGKKGADIEKLRKERGDYMKWQLGNDSLERLRRFCVAWEFSRCKEAVEGQSEGETAVKSQLEELDARAHDRAAQGADVEAEMKRVAKEKASKAGGAMTSASAARSISSASSQ